MKQVAWILAGLVALGLLVALPLLARHDRPPRDCASSVVIVDGPHGERLECACIAGALSTCFNPGP